MESSYSLSPMEKDYMRILKELYTDPEWYQASYVYYGLKWVWYMVLFAASIYCLCYQTSKPYCPPCVMGAFLIRMLGAALFGFYL